MSLQSEDYGKHLLSVQDLLEKHNLLEADIVTINERVKAINSQANKFIDQGLFRTYIGVHVCMYIMLLYRSLDKIHCWMFSCEYCSR